MHDAGIISIYDTDVLICFQSIVNVLGILKEVVIFCRAKGGLTVYGKITRLKKTTKNGGHRRCKIVQREDLIFANYKNIFCVIQQIIPFLVY